MTTAAFKKMRKKVMSRAGGFCECGCGRWIGDEGHLDHFFGRGAGRPAESVFTCWALSAHCDQQRTTNKPSSQWWQERFIEHAEKWRFRAADGAPYFAAAELARARLAVLEAKGLTT